MGLATSFYDEAAACCRESRHAGAHVQRRVATRQLKRACIRSAASALGEHARGGVSILDLGCGRGQALNALREYFGAGWRYVGVDTSRASLDEFARRAAPEVASGSVRLVHGDAVAEIERDPVPADLVLCLYAVHYFGDLGRAVRAMASCCRPGAVLLLMHADADTILDDKHASNYCAETDTYTYDLPPLVVGSVERRVPTADLCARARQSGLELASTTRLDHLWPGKTGCDLQFFRATIFRRPLRH